MSEEFCERIFKAAKSGNETELRKLLSIVAAHGCEWTQCRNKNFDNLLHLATRYKRLHVLRLLLERNEARSQINVGNNLGKTALHEAVQIYSIEIANYLLLQGSDANALTSNGWTPLMLAASKNEPQTLEFVALLIHHKADPFVQNKDGWTAFHIACRNGNISLVEYFITLFPNLVLVKSKNGRYPLHTAALYGRHSIVKLLLKTKCEIVSVCDYCGATPIHEAARSNNCDIMKTLIENGASIYEVDLMGLNCLHMAAQTAAISVIHFLVSTWKIDINIKNKVNNFTPLHYAAQAGQGDAIRELLKLGADPTSEDSKGRLPWEVAYGNSLEQYLKIIQERGDIA